MAKEDGYIKVSRKLLDWDHSDNMALTGFWIILLLKAQWEDSRKLKRGEFYTTQEILAAECNIHRSTVRRYLDQLRKSGQIKTSTDHRRTKITIAKWDEYQLVAEKEPTAEPTSEPTTEPTAEPTLLYKRNKEMKNKRREAQPPTLSEIKEFIEAEKLRTKPERFFEYYQERNWRGITDWKAKAREWDKTEVQRPQQKEIRKVPVPDYMEEKTVKPATEEEVPF